MTVIALPHRLGPALNRCDRPTITSVCASLVRDTPCAGLLAYQSGWQHVNACRACMDGGPCPTSGAHRWCDDPEPRICPHGTCTETVDVHIRCAAGEVDCCGCCWKSDDILEGRDLWPR